MATSKIKATGLGAPQSVDLWSNWTAPANGIVNAVVGWNNGASYGYCYIKDTTTGDWVCMISNANNLGGFSESASFPVIKGHVYKVDSSNQVGSLNTKFYSL